jgi:hypothetical protein
LVNTGSGSISAKFPGSAVLSAISASVRRTATGINTFDELKAYRQFNMGAPTRGTSSFIDSAILKNMLSVAIDHVTGYARGAEQRGANWTATCGASSSIAAEWIANRKINPVIKFAPELGVPASISFAGDLIGSLEEP